MLVSTKDFFRKRRWKQGDTAKNEEWDVEKTWILSLYTASSIDLGGKITESEVGRGHMTEQPRRR